MQRHISTPVVDRWLVGRSHGSSITIHHIALRKTRTGSYAGRTIITSKRWRNEVHRLPPLRVLLRHKPLRCIGPIRAAGLTGLWSLLCRTRLCCTDSRVYDGLRWKTVDHRAIRQAGNLNGVRQRRELWSLARGSNCRRIMPLLRLWRARGLVMRDIHMRGMHRHLRSSLVRIDLLYRPATARGQTQPQRNRRCKPSLSQAGASDGALLCHRLPQSSPEPYCEYFVVQYATSHNI